MDAKAVAQKHAKLDVILQRKLALAALEHVPTNVLDAIKVVPMDAAQIVAEQYLAHK